MHGLTRLPRQLGVSPGVSVRLATQPGSAQGGTSDSGERVGGHLALAARPTLAPLRTSEPVRRSEQAQRLEPVRRKSSRQP
jgi:hypothetical protein